MSRYPVAVYNVGPFLDNPTRTLATLHREANGIVATGAKVITLVETIGWGDLFDLPGYDLWRDRTTEGRANITVYTRKGLDATDRGWHPCHQTWRMTRDGAKPSDRHPAREVRELVIDGGQWLFSHDPPLTKWRDTGPARAEHQALLINRMAPWTRTSWGDRTAEDRERAKGRLRVNLGDPNGLGDDLAKAVGGWYEGTQIEGGTVVGGHWINARKQAHAGGVRMGSDHSGLFLGTVVAS